MSLRWMLLDLTNVETTLAQVIAWCHQATNHNINQCWPRSLSPYGATRPYWMNRTWLLYKDAWWNSRIEINWLVNYELFSSRGSTLSMTFMPALPIELSLYTKFLTVWHLLPVYLTEWLTKIYSQWLQCLFVCHGMLCFSKKCCTTLVKYFQLPKYQAFQECPLWPVCSCYTIKPDWLGHVCSEAFVLIRVTNRVRPAFI